MLYKCTRWYYAAIECPGLTVDAADDLKPSAKLDVSSVRGHMTLPSCAEISQVS